MDTLPNSEIIKILLTIVLGATGTYLLLPQKHDRARPKLGYRVGLAFSTLAVLSFALLWKTEGGDFISRAFFYLFGFTAVGGGILTVISRDPIHNALWFASVVLSSTGLFLLSGAQFLAAGTVIVYAGAIVVTFLFVLMLAQKEGRAVYDRMARSPFWATLASFLLLFCVTFAVVSLRTAETGKPDANPAKAPVISAFQRLLVPQTMTSNQYLVLSRSLPETSRLPEATGNGQAFNRHVAGLGGTLYTDHLVTVELAGALLFVALIGALAIATPKAPIRPSTADSSPKL
ncbi:NADH-quinone oxidoreductase subunit J family protein [Tundrisphaera lichenicola]|uniref:NADH-quinone oxidoreductase subunit J family protein n=1 Tax=Tundrisphaera lichenicola TaxID=2029860 RepID=UPI003EBA078B